MSIEDLMEIEVTSVSRKAERLTDASAAVFVITQDDIRRSGVTSIPEALRMVPGVEVARIDSNKWAITARGFNGRFANKMLVLFDGRTVYSPLFSGVFWDRRDTLLEDIDRIEVIRGSEATLWGAGYRFTHDNISNTPTTTLQPDSLGRNLFSTFVQDNVTLNARLGWRPVKNIELSLVGQNLMHGRQLEFKSEIINTLPTGAERSFYGKITWTF